MWDFDIILEKIAETNRTTPAQVLSEMQQAINEAYDRHEEQAPPLWDTIFNGGCPNPEEFVLGIAALLQTSADAINLKELSSCGSYRV